MLRLTKAELQAATKRISGTDKEAEFELVRDEQGRIQVMQVVWVEELVPVKRTYQRRKGAKS